ncbi:MAG: tetratricopeptide repeat protein [Acidobacteriia bacterium]|nr:tetratricopeptide repeat protein [Terriglobia bacterium]
MKKALRLLFSLLPVLVLAAFVVSASGQNPPQGTPPQMAPDRKAYAEAAAIKEPDKKIEALDKFAKDFPDSTMVFSAYQAIFDTLVKNYPDQKARILEQAYKAVDKAPAQVQMKANLFNSLGSQLSDAGILLNEAETFASAGLALIEGEQALSQANPPPQTNPSTPANPNARGNANPQANLGRLKTNLQVTLGRIYLKQGKLDAAEKSLKDALAANPQLATASLAIAEVYNKRGDSHNALAAYINAAAAAKMPIAARQALNTLYAKSHNGSLAGLEETLDTKYVELNPPPFEVEPYKASAKRTDRVVLAEVFTGSGCPPCVAADLAADLARERYSTRELVVIMYHEHIPQPDPMTTPQTTARFKYYAERGVPTLAIDGATTVGGGARNATKGVYDRITKEIEKKLEVPAGARLNLNAVMSGSTVKTSVVVDKVTSESPDLKLHIVLVEGKLRYTGENGVRFHPMVVRSMAGTDGTGVSIKSKESQTCTWDFDLDAISAAIKKHLDEYEAGGHRGNTFTFTEKKYAIDPKDLSVAAFVQDEKTKAILQSVLIQIKP